jgi:hypothetical protein
VCQFLDCEYLNGHYCSRNEVEFNPKLFCLTYSPIKVEEEEDLDEELEDDELSEEEEWLDEEEEDEDLTSLADDD